MDACKSAIFAFGLKAKHFAFAGFFHLLWEFGAKIFFTDHGTPNTIHSFGDSVLVCKMHNSYCMIRKNFQQHLIPFHSSNVSNYNRLDENKPLQNACKRI